jgi:hypothetical protein
MTSCISTLVDLWNIKLLLLLLLLFWGTEDVHTGFWRGDLRERNNLYDLGRDGRIILKGIFKKWDGEAYTELIWKGPGSKRL